MTKFVTKAPAEEVTVITVSVAVPGPALIASRGNEEQLIAAITSTGTLRLYHLSAVVAARLGLKMGPDNRIIVE